LPSVTADAEADETSDDADGAAHVAAQVRTRPQANETRDGEANRKRRAGIHMIQARQRQIGHAAQHAAHWTANDDAFTVCWCISVYRSNFCSFFDAT
jgi:hypothetical protein